ncbi:MAG: NAD(P)H-binding protein [Hymenobacter sp.]|nr:NAD(P)H-binding protein [Hymenobacter sp.]
MKTILVIGASGFIGDHLAYQPLAEGYQVRCLARKPATVGALVQAGCQLMPGNITNLASLQSALARVDVVYVSIQTLVPQHARTHPGPAASVAVHQPASRRTRFIARLSQPAQVPGTRLARRGIRYPRRHAAPTPAPNTDR